MPSSCKLLKTADCVKGIFKFVNNEKENAYNLEITVKAFDKNGRELAETEGRYALYIEPDHEATVTVELPAGTVKAQAVSYRYTVSGSEKSGDFEKSVDATYPVTTTADSKIDTREELADKLIDDIEHQFMLEHYEAHGYYDKEKNQVIIAAYATQSYNECYYAYSIDTTVYSTLAKAIEQMSLTCYEEFKKYNFSDVKVSVGFLSSDEQVMISATNGTIVNNFN